MVKPAYSVSLSGFVVARDIRERTDRFVLRVTQMDGPRLPTKLERVRLSVGKGTAPAVGSFVEFKARLHPTKRTGNVEACARRRAFKEAMRQRVREIAASLNLPDIQIKPVLKLKHEEIGRFCQTHSVNLGWLLEGIGPMFKAWPAS